MNLTVVTANFLIFCDRNITKSKENYEIQNVRLLWKAKGHKTQKYCICRIKVVYPYKYTNVLFNPSFAISGIQFT